MKKNFFIIKRIIKYGNYYINKLVTAISILIIASVLEVTCPMIIGYFIDNVLPKRLINPWIFISLVISFLILQVLSATLRYYQSILFNDAALNVIYKIRKEMMMSLLNQPLMFFDKNQTGKIISKVTNDTEVIKDLYIIVIASILRSVSLILFMLIAMFILDWRLACVSLIIFPIVIYIMYIYQKYSMPVVKILRSNIANINCMFHEIIKGITVIQVFRQQNNFRKKINILSYNNLKARMKNLKLDGYLLRPLLSLIFLLILCLIMLIFGLSNNHSVGVGTLYVFINYFGRLNEPLIELTSQQSIIQQAIVAGSRIFKIIDLPKRKYLKDVKKLKSGLVELINVNFSYKNKNKILNDVNMKIYDKSFVAIVGKTGSGKSTIANLIMNHYQINKGKILIDNIPIDNINRNTLHQNLTIVQQEPIIMNESLYFNISLGRKNIDENKVWNVLKMVYLDNLVKNLPDGLYTTLGEQGNILSIGQKQLLMLARALILIPSILILDEATSNIDYETEKKISNILKYIKKHTTIIVIAHRLSSIQEADNIFVLHKGNIIENGNHNTLLEKKGEYFRIYELQKKIKSISNKLI